jgi:hypothetical protein
MCRNFAFALVCLALGGNVFAQTVRGDRFVGNTGGTLTRPIFAPNTDPDTGIYFPAVGDMRQIVNGIDKVRFTGTSLVLDQVHVLLWGSSGVSTGDAGFSRAAAGVVGVTGSAVRFPDGTAALPAFTFTTDTNLGVYRHAADILGLSAEDSTRFIRPSGTAYARMTWDGSNGGQLRFISAGGTEDTVFARCGVNVFGIGGCGSIVPAVKRSAAILQIRLGDDTGYATLDAGSITANGAFLSTAGITAGAGNSISWSGRAALSSPTTTEINMLTNAQTENAGVRLRYVVDAVTASVTLGLTECNEVQTNTGDTDGTVFTLPPDPTIGCAISFASTVAQQMQILPNTGETIRYDGSTCADVRIGAAIGESITLISATGGNGAMWIPLSNIGGFTCTP